MLVRSVIQPSSNTTLSVLRDCFHDADITQLDVAVAYITSSGFRELNNVLGETLGDRWRTLNKRWVTSFDYMRTEPSALRSIRELPRSSVRIHNSNIVDRPGCIPATPFHPKVFITKGRQGERVLAGSGNLSRSGLCRGHEAGVAIGASKRLRPEDAPTRKAITSYKSWFSALWRASDLCDDALLAAYAAKYRSTPNLKNPAVTEDDVLPIHPNQLTAEDLRKLRVCENFWIEAGNITKNLGPNRPGNQLMMKRLSRVFFGVPPVDVPQNSPLTHLTIAFGGHEGRPCSLTFSDNGMDKLTLPAPALFGPPKYDNENLLFRRINADTYALELGTAADKRAWVRWSKAIQANFSMSSGGRKWGVF